MSHRFTCPTPVDLLMFQDSALPEARQREIEDHLKHCLPCRRQLQESDEIGRMLRAYIPLIDDPVGRARLKERLREQSPQPVLTSAASQRTMPYRLLAVSLAVIVILGSSLIWSDSILGGSSFTRFWRSDGTAGRVFPADRIQQTPASAPDTVIAPPSLPFELALTEGSAAVDASYGEWFYRNPAGFAIRIAIDPPGEGWLPTSDIDDRQELIGYDGREFVVMYGADQSDVLALFWVENESLHSLSVLTQPPKGLSLDDALAIVAEWTDAE